MIRAALAERLGHRRLHTPPPRAKRPPVAILLQVDREYREKAQEGALHLLAPKRFNPKGEAWLPVLHTRRGAWMFTAIYSNTALAHKLDRTRDWVVIYYSTNNLAEDRCTVVTETRRPLLGRRVVRGREAECLAGLEAA
jgi:hypothetical protein